jgi:ribosomal protein S18 acetylase RimI-like enzyme
MQSLQQEAWALEGPGVLTHVGDLAWWATMHVGREGEWRRRLWLDGERCVAWAWMKTPASLDYDVHPDLRAGALHDEVLDWFESEAEGDEPRSTYALEDDAEWRGVLQGRGYAPVDSDTWYAYYVQDLDDAPARPEVPPGFTLRAVRGDGDLRERVAAHRAAWEPSRVTEESYRNVMSVWPYRADLDCVLEAPDGSLVASALCWYDDANRVGELEPVGTHPAHRQRGFGAAVCGYALRRLYDAGGRQAVVYAGGRDRDEGARRLYESVGFRRHTRAIELRKERW